MGQASTQVDLAGVCVVGRWVPAPLTNKKMGAGKPATVYSEPT
jgi:hypothetical protein